MRGVWYEDVSLKRGRCTLLLGWHGFMRRFIAEITLPETTP